MTALPPTCNCGPTSPCILLRHSAAASFSGRHANLGLRGSQRPANRATPYGEGFRVFATSQPQIKHKDREAVLFQRLKTHDKALTAALILTDNEDQKEFITASLDKGMAFWRLQLTDEQDDDGHPKLQQVVRLVPSGSPIFSFCKDGWNLGDSRKQVFCGNMAREILAWEPGDASVQETVVLDGHSGWVRALAKHKKWLFSASCNKLRQYDMTRAIPSLGRAVTLDKGDILALVTGGDCIFAAGADGSIRSWLITKSGELVEMHQRLRAHGDRVAGLRWHANFLYSVSHDGSVKMWDSSTMELVNEVPKAHDGTKVTCLAVGPNGYLYTGGDDKLIRRWDTEVLGQAAEPLYCHNHSIRTLNAGKLELLLAGDAGGEVSAWRI